MDAIHEEGDRPPGSEEPHERDSRPLFKQLADLLPGTAAVQITEDHIQSLISARRGREELFGRHLFSDPAWDIILELYAANLAKRRMSASELARTIGAPQSVITRWIRALADAKIVSPQWNAHDLASPTIELTQEAASKMAQLAAKWGSAFVAI